MHEYVHHNDHLVAAREARLSPSQAGLFNGWGVFTTLLVHRSIPFAFEKHWERLLRDSSLTMVELPVCEYAVRQAVLDVAAANGVTEGLARVYFVNNHAGIWRGVEDLPDVDCVVCTGDLPVYPGPAELGVRRHGRHAAHPLAGTKVTSWLSNVWMLQEARSGGFDEVVLLNERDEVSECTAANVFCVTDDRIETPPLDSGCLAGVTRDLLMELGVAEGLSISERVLHLDDLLSADEVFITSTSRGVLPVVCIDGHDVPNQSGTLVSRLAAVYQGFVEDYCDRAAAARDEYSRGPGRCAEGGDDPTGDTA